MADEQSSAEEQNNSLREEIVHLEQRLVNSSSECADIGERYHELNEKVESILAQQPDDSDDQDEFLTKELVERQKELRSHLEEELNKYKARIASYKNTQKEQEDHILDLQSRVDEYRAKCAKLEAALEDYSAYPEPPRVVPDLQGQDGSSMDLEATLLRLEQERNRCQGLSEINDLLREQLETATEANRALTSDVERLTEVWKRTRAELEDKEEEWKKEEQSFTEYFTKEHHRLLALWRHVLSFRSQFSKVKSSTERDLHTMRTQVHQTSQNITDSCLQLILSKTSSQADDKDELNREILKLNQEIFSLNLKWESEKAALNEKIQDLNFTSERSHALLEEKERINDMLTKRIDFMEVSLKEKEADVERKESLRESGDANICCRTVKDIAQTLLEDSEHRTWSGIKRRNLSPIRKVVLSSSQHSIRRICDNREFQECLAKTIRSTLQDRCLQTEELSMKLNAEVERLKSQQKLIEGLENDKQQLHQITMQLTSQLETVQSNMEELIKDTQVVRTSLADTGTQQTFLEQMKKSLNDQIESFNSENERLHKTQSHLHQQIEQLREEKDNLILTKQNLAEDLNKRNKNVTILEDRIRELEKQSHETQLKLDKVSMDKELLEQERQQFGESLQKLETQRSELDLQLARLQQEEDSLKSSVVSLQNINDSLTQEKLELSKTLSEQTAESESVRLKYSTERLGYEREKQELKETLEQLKEKYEELESEKEILKNDLAALEESKQDLEEEKRLSVQQNNDLNNQVTKLKSQQSTLEAELEQTRKEFMRHLESHEKISKEHENLTRDNAELSLKLEHAQSELSRAIEVAAALRDEKDQLENMLYASQQLSTALQEEKQELQREIGDQKSKMKFLKDQVNELKQHHEANAEISARQKDELSKKTQQLDQEYTIMLQNLRQQHKTDLDILTKEKESLRVRLEAAQDELVKELQKEHEELAQRHSEEVASLKKKMSQHELELEERITTSEVERTKSETELTTEKASLEQMVQELQKKLDDRDLKSLEVEKKLAASVEHYKLLIDDLKKEHARLNEEIKTNDLKYEEAANQLEIEIAEMKAQRDEALADVLQMKANLQENVVERKRSEEKLTTMSSSIDDVKKSREELEQKVLILEQKLKAAKSQVELVKKTQEDFKTRLKKAQSENSELRSSLQEAHVKLKMESVLDTVQKKANSSELQSALHDVEKSRLEARREVQTLRRQVRSLELLGSSKDRELHEMQVLLAKDEENEAELKNEMVKLKQKVLEAEASKEALQKELLNVRKKLSEIEHKLKLQQEEQNLTLQESLSGDKTQTELRLNLERSLVDATEETHDLRMKLNLAEGKVAAMEAQLTKLEAEKHEMENKLQSLHFSLRSSLGLGTDSGFQGSSANLLSPFLSRKGSSLKLGESAGFMRESTPLPDRARSLSSSPMRTGLPLYSMDLNNELVKLAVQDFSQKLASTERERDDLRDEVKNLQRQLEEAKEEYRTSVLKLQTLQRDLEVTFKEKKEVEDLLSSTKGTVFQLESNIRTLEKEVRMFKEENASLNQALSSAESSKNELKEKVAELKNIERRLKEEQESLTDACITAESKVVKAELYIKDLEALKNEMQQTITSKSSEIESLHEKVDGLKKSVHSSELNCTSLKMSMERLNTLVNRQKGNESALQGKINSLEKIQRESSASFDRVSKEFAKIKREHAACEEEKAFSKSTADNLRSTITELKHKNSLLKEELDDRANGSKDNELRIAELEGQILGFQTMVTYGEEAEKAADDKKNQLEREKFLLEQQLARMKVGLTKNEELRQQAEKQKLKAEKEHTHLKKTLEKVERERQKTEEVANRSIIERTALGKSLSSMEIENQQLMRKLQNLQAQLAEMEQRHIERIKDLDKRQKFELKLELERLKTTQHHMEQLLETKEKSHRQKVSALEQRIQSLQSQLSQKHVSLGQPARSHSYSFLNESSSSFIPKASGSSQDVRFETIKYDASVERMDSNPIVVLSAPSKVPSNSSGSTHRVPSTSHARRRLDKSYMES